MFELRVNDGAEQEQRQRHLEDEFSQSVTCGLADQLDAGDCIADRDQREDDDDVFGKGRHGYSGQVRRSYSHPPCPEKS